MRTSMEIWNEITLAWYQFIKKHTTDLDFLATFMSIGELNGRFKADSEEAVVQVSTVHRAYQRVSSAKVGARFLNR